MRSISTRQASGLLVAAVAAWAVALPSAASAQKKPPLSVNKIVSMLEQGVPDERVTTLVREQGVTFSLTKENENKLREGGASAELVRVIRQVAPKPAPSPAPSPRGGPTPSPSPQPQPAPQPAVLSIQVTPGGAVAYVDDEPVGTASPEGRLKLSHLTPGLHTVRLSSSGYRDDEENVNLIAGQTTALSAKLQAVKLPSPSPSPSPSPNPAPGPTTPSGPSGPSSSGAPGYLGIQLMNPQPPGARGVVVSGADPGGPADQAGIRTYNVILSVDNRPVATPQALQQSVVNHHAGDTIDIAYYNGSQTVTRRVRLGSRPAEVSSNNPGPAPQTYQPSGGYQQPSYGTNTPRSGPSSGPSGRPAMAFLVVHDHGPPAPNFCAGQMWIENGALHYRSTTGVHPLDIPLSEIKEAKRNTMYLADLGAFHIKVQKESKVYNFVVVNQMGQYQPPHVILNAINGAMGR